MIDLALGPARRRQELFRETARNMGIYILVLNIRVRNFAAMRSRTRNEG